MITAETPEAVRQARKALRLYAPISLALLGVLAFNFIPNLLSTVDDLIAKAPIVRIGWADPLALVVCPLLLILLVSLVLKAIPAGSRFQPALVRSLLGLLIAGAVLLLGVLPAARFAQPRYMTGVGYSPCDSLQGNPTIWFQDWVRDSAWCVKGKTKEWVREQAASQAKS